LQRACTQGVAFALAEPDGLPNGVTCFLVAARTTTRGTVQRPESSIRPGRKARFAHGEHRLSRLTTQPQAARAPDESLDAGLALNFGGSVAVAHDGSLCDERASA